MTELEIKWLKEDTEKLNRRLTALEKMVNDRTTERTGCAGILFCYFVLAPLSVFGVAVLLTTATVVLPTIEWYRETQITPEERDTIGPWFRDRLWSKRDRDK